MLGSLSVIAGVLGMNFPQFEFFATGAHGFWTSIAMMTGFSVSALLVAWMRGWL